MISTLDVYFSTAHTERHPLIFQESFDVILTPATAKFDL